MNGKIERSNAFIRLLIWPTALFNNGTTKRVDVACDRRAFCIEYRITRANDSD